MDLFSSEQVFTHDGVTTQYYVFGSGPPILFLHGLGAAPKTYRDFLTKLADHCTVIAPQIPPFGRSSSIPQSWTVASYATYFHAFLIHQGWRSIPVVGHSYGGAIAFALATDFPGITAVFAINPMGVPCLTTWKEIGIQVLGGTIGGYLRGRPTMKLYLAKDFVLSFLRHALFIPKMITIIRRVCGEADIEFSQIHQPVFVLWGKKEELFPDTYISELQRLIPHANIENVDGYHNWIFFHPETAVQIIMERYRLRENRL